MSGPCDMVLDRLLQRAELDEKTASHVASCPACAAIHQSIREVRREKRLLDPAPGDLLAKVLRSLPTTPPPSVPGGEEGVALIQSAKNALIIGTVVVTLGSAASGIPERPPLRPGLRR
jgi:hypothetical protein